MYYLIVRISESLKTELFSWEQCQKIKIITINKRKCSKDILSDVIIIFVILQLSKIIYVCLSAINRISSNNETVILLKPASIIVCDCKSHCQHKWRQNAC